MTHLIERQKNVAGNILESIVLSETGIKIYCFLITAY
jgi:hypothetical protein